MAGGSRKGAGSGSKQVKRGKRKAMDSDDEAQETKKVKTLNSGVKKKPDLSKFKGLPLILLPEIFKHLSPSDLVNLCDAALIFWHALCRNSESYLWKTCRENEGIYEIPDGMNEYYWAKLLFSTRCMECGAENVRLADFYLRRRICKECKKTRCIDGRLREDFSYEAYECSPVTHFTAGGSKATHNEVYWRADVAQQHAKLAVLQNDVELDKPGATRALEEYKASRRKLLRTIRAEVGDFTDYQDKYLAKKKEEKEDLFQPLYEEIESRLVELGYLTKDFPPNMKMHKLVRSKTKLTERAWQSIRETLEREIKGRRDSREKQEWTELKVSRRLTLDKAYASHKFGNVAHLLWKSLPHVHTLCMLQPFDELITCDKYRKLTTEDFAPPLAQLDALLASAYGETKTRLRQSVVAAKDPFLSELESAQEFQDLQLATIVFRCKHCQHFIFGFEDIGMHRCASIKYSLTLDRDRDYHLIDPKPFSKEFPLDCVFQEGAADVVRMTIEACGLDPKITTTAQMDRLDLRLRCGCSAGLNYWVTGYKWCNLVTHIFKHHEKELKDGNVKRPEVVPEACMPEIRKEEAKSLEEDFGRRFACVHCELYGLAAGMCRYEWTVQHIQRDHGIQNPQLDVDLVDLSGKRVLGRGNDGVSYYVTPR